MTFKEISLFAVLFIFLLGSCKDQPTNKENELPQNNIKKDSIVPEVPPKVEEEEKAEEKAFELTEDNSIEFFFNYSKTLKENKVKLTTSLGDITIELFDNVPYHKANFIYLTKMGYFNNTYFHRVVKNFIIQGGNADNVETAEKRSKIGRYLLPRIQEKDTNTIGELFPCPAVKLTTPINWPLPTNFL